MTPPDLFVTIVPHDPRWASDFKTIRARLADALGESAADIVHIGSTAIPGLVAKPIIDVDIVIADGVEVSVVIAKLATVGYSYVGERGIAGRHAFEQQPHLPHHHCYACAGDSVELHRHLAFRDALRARPELASAYAALKLDLAQRFPQDRAAYTEAKTAFVEAVLAGVR